MGLTRFGLHFSSTTYPGWTSAGLFPEIADVALAAEESGFDSLWVPDHAHQNPIGGGPTGPMLEAYTLLAALSQRTSAALLGALVSPVTFREPSLFAKTIASLDVVSGGRAVLGIGAAWDTDEHAAYGITFPPTRERFERLEDALRICAAMLRREPASYTGTHYSVTDAYNNPPPIEDHVPVLVGGGGERRTLRLVAQYADACNFFGAPADVTHKLEVLAEHCVAVGRERSEITSTAGIFAPADTAELLRNAAGLFEVGIDGVIVFGGNTPSPATVREWGEALVREFA